MTLVQLEVFLAVVQHGGFTRAGAALSMTQSAVSHIVQSLETELDAALLIRDRRGVKLTAAGERVLMHARQILSHTDALRQELQELKGVGAETIRIGSFPSVSAQLLPAMLDAFQTRYPAITLVHLDGTNQEVRHWIHTGAVHLGFVSLPDDEFRTVHLMQDEMVLLLPANHPLATRTSIPVEELRSEAFVMTKGGCEAFILKLLAPTQPDIRYEAKETSTILTMVQQGLGVTILPRLALPTQLEQIAVLSLDPPQYRQLGLAVNPDASTPPAVSAFLEHAKEWIKKVRP